MSRICPSCSHEREPAAGFVATPDWQCPACGIAYEKAQAVANHAARQVLAHAYTRTHVPGLRRTPAWRLWAGAGALLAACAWGGHELAERGAGIQHHAIHELAAGVRPGDLRFYSAAGCSSCDQARAWLDQHGIAYEECNVGEPVCAHQLRSYGTRSVPYFILRNERELSGFHRLRMVELLKAPPAPADQG